jgi:hypothetical protein
MIARALRSNQSAVYADKLELATPLPFVYQCGPVGYLVQPYPHPFQDKGMLP